MNNYLDHAPCFYFSTSDEGKLLEVNARLCNKLGYTKEELIGQKVECIFPIATKIFYQTHLFPLLKMQEHAEEIFVTLQAKDKEQVPVLFNAERKTVNNEAMIFYAGIIVRNRKKFEDELIAAKKEAETALRENTALAQAKQALQKHTEELDEQMRLTKKQHDELRQFNRVVTHDLKEPLRKLSLFINMMQDEKIKMIGQTMTERLLRVTEQMRSIVTGLQQYIWLTDAPQKPTVIDLHTLLPMVKQQLAKEFPAIELEIETEELLPFHADREQMQLLFYELLSNAIRFRKEPNKANVKISCDSLLRNKYRSLEGQYKYTDFVRLQVKDEGIGFDATYKDQTFELFKRLHAVSGRGVGLALCKKIVENHQGEISIDSKEGEGTVVTILLPVQQNN